MKLSAALIASAVCLSGLADAKVHKAGLKKIPQEDFSIVLSLAAYCQGHQLMIGTYAWCNRASETEVHGPRSSGT